MSMKTKVALRSMVLTVGLLISFTTSHAGEIEVSHTSTYAGSGRYRWTIYIKAEPSVLNRIDYVEYRLHPTFHDPLRKVKGPKSGSYPFSTSDVALDTFNVGVTVYFSDNQYSELPDYTLTLRPKSTSGNKVVSKTTIADKSSKYLKESEFRGRLEVRVANLVVSGDSFKTVLYLVDFSGTRHIRIGDPIATGNLNKINNKLYFEFGGRKYVLVGLDFRPHLTDSKMDFEIYRLE